MRYTKIEEIENDTIGEEDCTVNFRLKRREMLNGNIKNKQWLRVVRIPGPSLFQYFLDAKKPNMPITREVAQQLIDAETSI